MRQPFHSSLVNNLKAHRHRLDSIRPYALQSLMKTLNLNNDGTTFKCIHIIPKRINKMFARLLTPRATLRRLISHSTLGVDEECHEGHMNYSVALVSETRQKTRMGMIKERLLSALCNCHLFHLLFDVIGARFSHKMGHKTQWQNHTKNTENIAKSNSSVQILLGSVIIEDIQNSWLYCYTRWIFRFSVPDTFLLTLE